MLVAVRGFLASWQADVYVVSPRAEPAPPYLHLASCWQTKWNHPSTPTFSLCQGCEIRGKRGSNNIPGWREEENEGVESAIKIRVIRQFVTAPCPPQF